MLRDARCDQSDGLALEPVIRHGFESKGTPSCSGQTWVVQLSQKACRMGSLVENWR